jgi:hypothetical protein
VTIRWIVDRERARALLTQLGADPDSIPEDEFLTKDDFFVTPTGIAAHWQVSSREELDDLLYREPSGDDPGGWLRRPLTAAAKARGLTRATSWEDVEDQRELPQCQASPDPTSSQPAD